jgi:hypothetical protein
MANFPAPAQGLTIKVESSAVIARKHQETTGGHEGQSKRRLNANLLRRTSVEIGTKRHFVAAQQWVALGCITTSHETPHRL